MKKVQYVSKYIRLSEEGLVPRIECPMDQGPLFCNQNMEDEIYLYCLSCNYKKVIGSEYYDTIREFVQRHSN